ncbi:helix-turn-helix domain-containing protein [Myxococcus llanfairpwllgwyngyllgogerychwyrndrobwllllantysiliogogogochensis]|uniref:helix-turn-helix domain-containing protein n=1 Tax=Myxococcus llanfairpwllgwyngyllgogerychwyrndrobwllllantysiliogogogochensis TaxID=2590453 RepID=UPI001FE7DF52|nr:helix-turn-helix domain-containing protein [Myxococcus llanfairpwllgwyngyllgogerychwyrndrobwllllantysiliogogogochensis]
MSSAEAGLRDLIRAQVREELVAFHADAAHREPVQAGPPGSTSPDGQPPLDKAVYTAEEVARFLGCSPKAVYAKVSRGQLPGMFRVGRSLRFRGRELLPFILEGRAP